MSATHASVSTRPDTGTSEAEGPGADTPGARAPRPIASGHLASGLLVADTKMLLHHGSHETLLAPVSPAPTDLALVPAPRERRIDAIFVPTVRRPVYLAEVSALAKQLGCALVTLHSGHWTSAHVLAQRMPADIDLIAIDVKASDRLRLPAWQTSNLLAGKVFARHTDLSAKRNLALVLSHLLGWERILFLDDDITGLNPQHIRQASGLLDTHSAVGLRIGGFPDNSVVCHAYREAGGPQQSFVGGGALLIEVKATNSNSSFFPDIYNEDWFFLLDGDRRLLPTTTTGRVIQQPYDPFRTPNRARAEEFGDVLAEGIYWLLDQGRSIHDADCAHWTEFIAKRHLFISEVLEMVAARGDLDAAEKTRRLEALRGSLGRLALITPQLCEDYLSAWNKDRQAWRGHLEQLPFDLRRSEAMPNLTQPGSPSLTWRFGKGSDTCRSHSRKLGGVRSADVLPMTSNFKELVGDGYHDLREVQKVRLLAIPSSTSSEPASGTFRATTGSRATASRNP